MKILLTNLITVKMNIDITFKNPDNAINSKNCEMLIGGRKTVFTDSFFEVNNIRNDVKNNSSEFYGLLHEMVLNDLFINQEISYINDDGEMNFYNVTYYIS